jgi:hypothetical protein
MVWRYSPAFDWKAEDTHKILQLRYPDFRPRIISGTSRMMPGRLPFAHNVCYEMRIFFLFKSRPLKLEREKNIGCFFSCLTDKRRPDAIVSLY